MTDALRKAKAAEKKARVAWFVARRAYAKAECRLIKARWRHERACQRVSAAKERERP